MKRLTLLCVISVALLTKLFSDDQRMTFAPVSVKYNTSAAFAQWIDDFRLAFLPAEMLKDLEKSGKILIDAKRIFADENGGSIFSCALAERGDDAALLLGHILDKLGARRIGGFPDCVLISKSSVIKQPPTYFMDSKTVLHPGDVLILRNFVRVERNWPKPTRSGR